MSPEENSQSDDSHKREEANTPKEPHAGAEVPRRTFIKYTGQAALFFAMVDLVTPAANANPDSNPGTCNLGTGADAACNDGTAASSVFDKDGACSILDQDQSCRSSGGVHEEDQSCDTGVNPADEGCQPGAGAALDEDNNCQQLGSAPSEDEDAACQAPNSQTNTTHDDDASCGGGTAHNQDEACYRESAGSNDGDANCSMQEPMDSDQSCQTNQEWDDNNGNLVM